ncbi:hypothetical protein HQH16_14965 [Raoultella ornithinolytica]|uniref:hypothetical protein n=1 Tax=Raoultella ornithinolytica TaxID=54291 RepID=UPI0019164E49|nr:hypothetical protein [Raoultella ornithinolytica]QQO49560.1 hypothetical protein HQH16_14965 [Raoultella ornithinolytica]
MTQGLMINVPSNFSRVLTDLSFIPDVAEEAIAYRGLYGESEAASLLNTSTASVASNVKVISPQTPAALTYGKGYFKLTGPGADGSASTGIRLDLTLSSIEKNGYPLSMGCAFRNLQKTKEAGRMLYPIASFYLSAGTVGAPPFLCIAAYIGDDGARKIAAWSGSISDAVGSLPLQCAVDVDWQTTDLISACVSRAADGVVSLAVKKVSSPVVTKSFAFSAVPDQGSAESVIPRIVYGSMNTRTLGSAELMSGEYWQSRALSLAELSQQASLTYLKAVSRL